MTLFHGQKKGMTHFAHCLVLPHSPSSPIVPPLPSCLENKAVTGQRQLEDTCLHGRPNIRHHFKSNQATEEAKVFQRGEKTRLSSKDLKESFEETFRWMMNLIFHLLPFCYLEVLFLCAVEMASVSLRSSDGLHPKFGEK